MVYGLPKGMGLQGHETSESVLGVTQSAGDSEVDMQALAQHSLRDLREIIRLLGQETHALPLKEASFNR